MNVRIERGSHGVCAGCGQERGVIEIAGSMEWLKKLRLCEMCEGSLLTLLNEAAALGGASLFDLTVSPGSEFTVLVNGQTFLTGRADGAGPVISKMGGS